MRKFFSNIKRSLYETHRVAALASGSRRERREAARIRKSISVSKPAAA